jgi:predicted ATPase
MLKRSVVQRGEGRELALEPLDEPDVAAYLRGRFAWEQEPVGLVHAVHEQSEGNPLFMVTLANRIAADAGAGHPGGRPSPGAVPDLTRAVGTETLRELVASQIGKIASEDIEMLEAASVAGPTFGAQSVAAALGVDELWVEKACGRLAGWELFIEDAGEDRWPDGSTAERYAFLHDVFRQVLYDRIPAARRQHLHRRVGERLAIGYASQADGLAAELAVHSERGGDPAGAVVWLERAAAGVRRRFADREAVEYINRAIALLGHLPECEERNRRELALRLDRKSVV